VNSTLKIRTPEAITLIEKIKAEIKKRAELKAKRKLLKLPKRLAKRWWLASSARGQDLGSGRQTRLRHKAERLEFERVIAEFERSYVRVPGELLLHQDAWAPPERDGTTLKYGRERDMTAFKASLTPWTNGDKGGQSRALFLLIFSFATCVRVAASNPAHLILTRTNKLFKSQPPRLGCFFRE
jgi:hypothetical protein